MTTHLQLTARLADRGLDVDLRVGGGETLALLGPNGSGKSSILGILAGLVRPDDGAATLGTTTLFDLGRHPGRWLPPHRRRIGMVAQDPLLFPHLTAAQNVAFGPRSAGRSRRRAHADARAWLARVDATDLAGRRPHQMSGGQAQRVALARALATEPDLLLLDEPLAAIDVTAVPQLRALIRRTLVGRTAVLVTHDVLDAVLLADRVVVITDGRVVEDGPTRDVLTRPRSRFGAHIAGLNLVAGTFVGGVLRDAGGRGYHGIVDGELADGSPAVAVFSPAAVAVRTDPLGAASPRNVVPTIITELEPHGSRVRIRTDAFDADVTAAAVAELDLAPGRRIHLAVKASEVRLHPS